jgi:hypothetical protein
MGIGIRDPTADDDDDHHHQQQQNLSSVSRALSRAQCNLSSSVFRDQIIHNPMTTTIIAIR